MEEHGVRVEPKRLLKSVITGGTQELELHERQFSLRLAAMQSNLGKLDILTHCCSLRLGLGGDCVSFHIF